MVNAQMNPIRKGKNHGNNKRGSISVRAWPHFGAGWRAGSGRAAGAVVFSQAGHAAVAMCAVAPGGGAVDVAAFFEQPHEHLQLVAGLERANNAGTLVFQGSKCNAAACFAGDVVWRIGLSAGGHEGDSFGATRSEEHTS